MKKINLILSSLLALPIVSAQGIPVPDILKQIIETIFSGNVETAYMRLILFIGIFTIFYALLNGIGPFSKEATKRGGISVTLALVLSAIASFTMPEATVNLVFNLYSGLFGLILLLGPILYLIYFVYKHVPGDSKGGHFIRFLILLLLAAILLSPTLINSIDLLKNVGADEYLAFAGLILFILAIIELVKTFGSGGSGDAPSKPSEPWGSGMSNWFSDRKKGIDNWTKKKGLEREQKQLEEEKKQEENIKRIGDLGESISKLNVSETNDLKALNQLVSALHEVQDKESFLKHETRLQMLPALKDAANKLKAISERLTKTLNQKNILEDDSQREAARLLESLEREYDLLVKDSSITDEQIKAEFRRRFSELITKIRNDNNKHISLKDLKKKYRALITDLQTKVDQLIRNIDRIEVSSKKLNVAQYAIDKNEYRNIMESIRMLKEEIIEAFKTMSSYHKSLNPEELAQLEQQKNDLVREVNEQKNKFAEELEKINELSKKAKAATTVEEKEEILEAEKKIAGLLPQNASVRKAANKIIIEDAKIIEETSSKSPNKISDEDIIIEMKKLIEKNFSNISSPNSVNGINSIIELNKEINNKDLQNVLNTHIEKIAELIQQKNNNENGKYNIDKLAENFSIRRKKFMDELQRLLK
jgi:hypothetical protein